MSLSKYQKNMLCLSIAMASLHVQAQELGIQLYSLRHQIETDLPTAMRQVKEWGFEVAEGGGMLFGYPLPAYKAELDKNHIKLVSVDTSFEELQQNPMTAVLRAHYFGAKYATFYWIPHDKEKGFRYEDAQKTVELMNLAGPILKKHGISLQYHPHGYEFLTYKDGHLLDHIIQNVHEAQFQMDVFWVKQAGMDPLALLQKYPGRFTSLHLKDRKIGSKNSKDGYADLETNVVLGQGDVGIAELVREAKRQGIEYYFVEDESSRVMHQMPLSIAYLRQLGGKFN